MNPGGLRDWLRRIKSTGAKMENPLVLSSLRLGVEVSAERHRGSDHQLRSEQSMVVVMQEGASETQIQHVIEKLVEMGFDIHRSTGVIRTVLGVVGGKMIDTREIELLDGVSVLSPMELESYLRTAVTGWKSEVSK